MDLLNATEDSSPCNSTPMNLLSARDRLHLEQEERAIARLQHWRQREQEGRRSERTDVRQPRLDRRHVHGKESVAVSGSIGVKLDIYSEGPSCQLALNIKHSKFEDSTALISDIIFLY